MLLNVTSLLQLHLHSSAPLTVVFYQVRPQKYFSRERNKKKLKIKHNFIKIIDIKIFKFMLYR